MTQIFLLTNYMRANPQCWFNSPEVQKSIKKDFPPGDPDYEDYKAFMLAQKPLKAFEWSPQCAKCAQLWVDEGTAGRVHDLHHDANLGPRCDSVQCTIMGEGIAGGTFGMSCVTVACGTEYCAFVGGLRTFFASLSRTYT